MIIKKNKLQKYLDSLIHYGHKTNELNPKMSSYMLSEENGYHIFDLRKIEESLLLSSSILKQKKIDNQKVLFVGTNKIFSSIIKKKAEEISELITEVRGSHITDTWPKQASLAAEGKWDELKKWQDELD